MSKVKFQNYLSKITEYLFYLFIFLLPWQTRLIYHQGFLNGGAWEYGTLSLYGTEIILGLVLLGSLVLFCLQRPRPDLINRWWVWLGVLFLFYVLVSSLWSVDQRITGERWIGLIEAVAVGCLVSWQKFDFKKISYSFVAAGLLQGILAIYQFLTQAVVGNKWLGIATQAVGQSGVSVVEGAGRWLRAYGSLPHPNLLAGYLAASLFFLLGLLFAYYRKNCSAPRQFSAARVGEAIFLFGSLVIITYGLLLTFSRSAWLGTIVGLLFVWFFPGRRRDPLARKFFIKINLFILLVVILFVANYGALLFPRLTASSRLEAQSITERQAGWQEAITLIKSRPVWGVGLGAYTRALYDQDKTRSAWEYQPVHNLDLLIMAELGMVGWLLLLVVILLWLYQGLAKLFRGENQFGMFVGAALLNLLVIGIFDHYLWSLFPGLILAALVFGSFHRVQV